MICIIALAVFSLLGLFSLKYRYLAKEAFECVFNRLRFRPCQTGLDQRIKSKIISKILKHNQKTGRFVNKYFEVISWFFVIIMLASFVYSAFGIYNLIRYKTCDPNHPENCPLTPKQIQQGCGCEDPECGEE
ncbi:MAG: hypothetical protein ABIG90_00455 [bacterium]